MIKMFPINDFDNFDRPNSSIDSADDEIKTDEFSALLNAFSFVPVEQKTPVSPEIDDSEKVCLTKIVNTTDAVQPENKAFKNAPANFAENIRTFNGNQKAPENSGQIAMEKNSAARSSIQKLMPEKSFANRSDSIISDKDSSFYSKVEIEQNENLPPIQNKTSENAPVKIENQISQKNFEIQFETRQPETFNFYAQSDAPIKSARNIFQSKDLQFSNSEYDVVVRKFSPEKTLNTDKTTSTKTLETEINTDFPAEIQTGAQPFTRKFASFLLPKLFQEVAKDLKKTNSVKSFEQTIGQNEFEANRVSEINEAKQIETAETNAADKQNIVAENAETVLKPENFNLEKVKSEAANNLQFSNDKKINQPQFLTSEKSKKNEQILPENPNVENLINQAVETNFKAGEKENSFSKIQKNVSEFASKIENFKEDFSEKKVFKSNSETAQNAPTAFFEKLISNENESQPIKNPANSLTTAQSEKVFEQISSRLKGEILIFTEKADKTNILKMRLRPAELGAVEIRLEKSESGKLRAHFQAETEATRQILVERSEQIREALQNSGWQIEKLDISCNSFSSTGEGERRDAQSRQSETLKDASSVATNFDDGSEKTSDSNSSNRLVNLRA